MTLPNLVLDPDTVAAWFVVGLAAGWLAGKVMENLSYGIIGNLLLGSIGAVVGGALVSNFVAGEPAFWVSVIMAFIGACILIVVARCSSECLTDRAPEGRAKIRNKLPMTSASGIRTADGGGQWRGYSWPTH
jgi:uncharacterized membrane protein YeaQ/YmgE (transglycosylase-associated protein family)